MPDPSLLQRLKERKLVQWALAYLAGAFVVFQAVEVLAEPWGLSLGLQRGVHVLLLAGLFITIVLAWYHGEKGRQRTSGAEVLMLAALLILAGAGISLVRQREGGSEGNRMGRGTAGARERPSVAVLPCNNIGPEPDSAFYARGIHETILLQLQRISGLATISRTSVMQYEKDPPPLTQIGSELGVGFVGECSVQKDADRIRVIFRLIDAVRDELLLAQEYDRDLSPQNLLEINSDIASGVAGNLQAVIQPEERARIDRLPTQSLTAHEAYFLGRHHLEEGISLPEAVRFFELALEEDPGFALARSGLAMAYDLMASTSGISARRGWSLAEQSALRALEIDSTLAEPYTVLADARMIRWDWDGAEEAFRRAIALQPSYAEAHQYYSILLIAQGRIEEALAQGQIAVAVNPRVGGSVAGQAIRLFSARRYEEALPLFEEASRISGRATITRWWASWCYAFAGQTDEALETAREALIAGADSVTVQSLVAGIHAVSGQQLLAREILQRLESSYRGEIPEGRSVDPASLGVLYALLGDPDSAFPWLELAVERGSWSAVYLGVGPWIDPLRDDPRYQAILDRIGLGHLKARFDSIAAPRARDRR
jgi:TolB-like protein/Tfp pilus assembly protein PilF